MHFAACADVSEAMSLPEKYFDNNLPRSLVLLNAVR
jgi:UDP-glucose 4-epimerase